MQSLADGRCIELQCKHIYHDACFRRWAQTKGVNQCPLRCTLPEGSEPDVADLLDLGDSIRDENYQIDDRPPCLLIR